MILKDPENVFNHIKKHFKDDKTKSSHGVFESIRFSEIVHIVNYVKKHRNELRKVIKRRRTKTGIEYESWEYCIKKPFCGYEGGKKGTGNMYNHIIVVLRDSGKLVTVYPGEDLFLEKTKQSRKRDSNGHDDR